MARSKYEADLLVSSLREELGYVMAGLSSQYVQLQQLLERLVSDGTVRPEAKDKKNDPDILSRYVSEVEQLKNQIVSVSARCQCLEKKTVRIKDLMLNAQGSSVSVEHLQNLLTDALEKNKQWLQYDQQREAYVRALLDRMSWLEKKD